MSRLNIWTWDQVGLCLKQEQPGTVLRIPKWQIEHPSTGGLTPSLGLPVGQRADFRLRYSDCRGLHVHDFGEHYEIHLDEVHPECGLVEHLRRDAPGTYLGAATALGAFAGLLLGKSRDAVVAGAFVGALLGALTGAPEGKGRRNEA